MNRLLVNGAAAIVIGFGAGWAALAMTTTKASPAARAASLVIAAPAPGVEAQSVEPAPLPEAPRLTAAPLPPAAAPAPAPKAETSEKTPSKRAGADKAPRELRFKAEKGDVSASVDPDGRKLRVRTPFGNYNFGL